MIDTAISTAKLLSFSEEGDAPLLVLFGLAIWRLLGILDGGGGEGGVLVVEGV